ncbi:hypothetical protein [Bacillus safensis]|uniref:hypothetical protein n=1 Tax=Bacillus safensis TaxID=561879 RepID=UPI002E1B3FF1|nr:hypothetical protein [Bacillus safensis]
MDYTQHKKYLTGKFKSKQEIIDKLKAEGKDDIYHVLSFGGGTQSAHLLEDHLQGKIHYDYIVFSDTGAEPEFIHIVEQGLTTKDSIKFLAANGFPGKRSRCYFCSFNCSSNKAIGMDWEEIIRDEPLSFLKACYFDRRLREVIRSGEKRLNSIPYFHYSRQPLKKVFKKEYELATELYGNELNKWLKEWSNYITHKYIVNKER